MFPANNLFYLTLLADGQSNEHTDTYSTLCFQQTKVERQQTIYGFYTLTHTHNPAPTH